MANVVTIAQLRHLFDNINRDAEMFMNNFNNEQPISIVIGKTKNKIFKKVEYSPEFGCYYREDKQEGYKTLNECIGFNKPTTSKINFPAYYVHYSDDFEEHEKDTRKARHIGVKLYGTLCEINTDIYYLAEGFKNEERYRNTDNFINDNQYMLKKINDCRKQLDYLKDEYVIAMN